MAAHKLQANIVILPNEYSNDFISFVNWTQKHVLVGQTKLNNPYFETLGDDIDIRSDVPLYNIYKNENLIPVLGILKSIGMIIL